MTAQAEYAPGWPGIPPRWTSSDKSGVGTALSPASHVWFTLSHGIFNEIYYPPTGRKNLTPRITFTRDGSLEQRWLDYLSGWPDEGYPSGRACRRSGNEQISGRDDDPLYLLLDGRESMGEDGLSCHCGMNGCIPVRPPSRVSKPPYWVVIPFSKAIVTREEIL